MTTTTTTTNDIVRLPLGLCLIRSAQLALRDSRLNYSFGVAVNARSDPAHQEPLVPVDPARTPDTELDPRGVVTLAPGVGGPEHLSMRWLMLARGELSSGQPGAAANLS